MINNLDELYKLAEFNYSIDLQRATDRLNPDERKALLLVYMVGLTLNEAAKELGVSAPLVHRRLTAAIGKIKKTFEIGVNKNPAHSANST